MPHPGPIGRLRFLLCLILTVGLWTVVGFLLQDAETDPAAEALMFHCWAVFALLIELAVLLRLRDLGRPCWWSIPAWLLYPMSAYIGWLIQRDSAYQSESMEWLWMLCFRIYAAGAAVVPITLLYLLLAPAREPSSSSAPESVPVH